jgi:hypothetical protein
MESPKTIFLLVPYKKKDELKALYKIKWDTKAKLWYTDEMVEALEEPYKIMKIQVEDDDKDDCKLRYKSIRWQTIDKTWTCSYEVYNEDYIKFIKK